VLAITIGADCSIDRVEASVLGHARDGTTFVLAHLTIWGSPLEDDIWIEVDSLLKQRWRHPSGGLLKVDAAVIDSGGEAGVYDKVLAFCNARTSRRVLAGKGASGFVRPMIQTSKTKRGRLFIVGVDAIKSQLISRLARGRSIRFSHVLDATYFEQLSSERKIVRMARGRPMVRFERIPGRRAESLDCAVYAIAAKAALNLSAGSFSQREEDLRSPEPRPAAPTVFPSRFMQRLHVR
jgi:phage terminase large subunit GpA-like protein